MSTPTSPNTASHIFAIPSAPSTRITALTPSAKMIFSQTILIVFLAIFMLSAIFDGLSSIRTISADSIAASEPMAPIAIPQSALISTGASFMPSPTNASLPLASFNNSSTFETLSAGRSSAKKPVRPSLFATFSATLFLSPVSITRRLTPTFLRLLTASSESSLIWSLITIWPKYSHVPFSSRAM